MKSLSHVAQTQPWHVITFLFSTGEVPSPAKKQKTPNIWASKFEPSDPVKWSWPLALAGRCTRLATLAYCK